MGPARAGLNFGATMQHWLMLSAIALSAGLAQAQPFDIQQSFDMAHAYDFRPVRSGPITITAGSFTHAFASAPSLPGSPQQFFVDPAGQPAGYNPYQWERFVGSRYYNGLVPVNARSVLITPAGGESRSLSSISFGGAGASASVYASNFASVAPYGPTGGFRASLSNVANTSLAGLFNAGPAMTSYAQFSGGASLSRGQVDFTPNYRNARSETPLHQTNYERKFDPMSLSIVDPSLGELFNGNLFTLNIIDLKGDTFIDYVPATQQLAFDASGAGTSTSVVLDFPTPFTSTKGRLAIDVVDGLISALTQTGDFAGLSLPAVGQPAVFSRLFSGFSFSYDVPLATADSNVTVTFYAGTESVDAPAPATVLALLPLALRRRRRSVG